MHKDWVRVCWAAFLTAGGILLALLLLPRGSHRGAMVGFSILFAIVAVLIAMVGLCGMLILTHLRRRRLERVDKQSVVARTPTLRIEPKPAIPSIPGAIQTEATRVDASQAVKPEHSDNPSESSHG